MWLCEGYVGCLPLLLAGSTLTPGLWQPVTNKARQLLGNAGNQRASHMGGQWERRHVGDGQHRDLPVRDIGITLTVEAMGLLAKTEACRVLYDKASLSQFRDGKGAFGVQVGRDAVSGQVICFGEFDLGVFRRTANPDGPTVTSVAAGIPDTDVVALADIEAWPLECHVFLAAKEEEIAHRRRRVFATEHRVDANAHRGDEVDLVWHGTSRQWRKQRRSAHRCPGIGC